MIFLIEFRIINFFAAACLDDFWGSSGRFWPILGRFFAVFSHNNFFGQAGEWESWGAQGGVGGKEIPLSF